MQLAMKITSILLALLAVLVTLGNASPLVNGTGLTDGAASRTSYGKNNRVLMWSLDNVPRKIIFVRNGPDRSVYIADDHTDCSRVSRTYPRRMAHGPKP
jgi:hypothetical protein